MHLLSMDSHKIFPLPSGTRSRFVFLLTIGSVFAARGYATVAGEPIEASGWVTWEPCLAAPLRSPRRIACRCGPTTYFGSAADWKPALKTLQRALIAPAESSA